MLTDKIRTANHDVTGGEAALTVACFAQDAADAAMLLDALGVDAAAAAWTPARVAYVTVAHAQHGNRFCSNDVRIWVPQRAWPHIQTALRWLAADGLAERTGRVATSASPGARGRKVPVYQLTREGDALSWEVRPPAGHRDLTEYKII